MAKYQLLLPKMGESVAEATIIKWLKRPGDMIQADEAVLEIATDKVDSEVPSPVSGRLAAQIGNENDVIQVGAVIAVIETAEAEPDAAPVNQPAAPVSVLSAKPQFEQPLPAASIPGVDQLQNRPSAPPPVHSQSAAPRFYSPLVRNIAAQEGLTAEELDNIPGTGADSRVTKDDLLTYIENRKNGLTQTASARQQAAPQQTMQQPQPVQAAPHHHPPAQPQQPQQVPQPQPPVQQPYAPPAQPYAPPVPPPAYYTQQQPQYQQEYQQPQYQQPQYQQQPPVQSKPASAGYASISAGDEIIEMDRMRKLIADHMVMSKQTSPHVTSFVEADVTNLVKWRDKVKKQFESREGTKITFTPLFIEAVAKAIKDMPMVNVSVNGTQIIKRKNINIGMATALPNGNLIVPVIKRADQLNMVGLVKQVNELADRARNNQLQPDEIREGTFTITNVGGFGNLMGTPIINQPQVAILAVGAIKKKPAVLETSDGDVIAIRHMMFLSLSYDHRVVDGALGGSFLKRVADYLEQWDINREV